VNSPLGKCSATSFLVSIFWDAVVPSMSSSEEREGEDRQVEEVHGVWKREVQSKLLGVEYVSRER